MFIIIMNTRYIIITNNIIYNNLLIMIIEELPICIVIYKITKQTSKIKLELHYKLT